MKRRISIFLFCVLLVFIWTGCSKRDNPSAQEVVVYTSEDQVFSEPILREFEKETGIKVRAVFDTEEAKSTGVMNRLIAEKDNPQADVFWANEPFRAQVLKDKGIAAVYHSPQAEGIPELYKDPDGYWTGFSARARVLVVNQSVENFPASILTYTDPVWRGKGVIANPLFGTTTVQVAALFSHWGEDKAKGFLEAMKTNAVGVSTSNGESTDFVSSGQYAFSLVDSDDAVSRMRQGRPITMVYPDQGPDEVGCLIVPNAVVLINGARYPDNARRLIDYLLSRGTERKLAYADCAQIPLHSGVDIPKEIRPIEQIKVMDIDYAEVARTMQTIQPTLKAWAGL